MGKHSANALSHDAGLSARGDDFVADAELEPRALPTAMLHDPMIGGSVKMPPALIPQPAKKAKTPASTAVARAAAGPPPTTMASTFAEVHAICAAAQAAAFPGVGAAVACAASDRPGVDYQNNSAMALFGILKGKGGLPDGIKSPRDCAEALISILCFVEHVRRAVHHKRRLPTWRQESTRNDGSCHHRNDRDVR